MTQYYNYRAWLLKYNLTLSKESRGNHSLSFGVGMHRIQHDFWDNNPDMTSEGILKRLADSVRGDSIKAVLTRQLLELHIGTHKVQALLKIGQTEIDPLPFASENTDSAWSYESEALK